MSHAWKFEEYSQWSQQLAKSYTRRELERQVGPAEWRVGQAAQAHLRAIEATTSMTSQSQRRAQTKNSMIGDYERFSAIKNAIELHDLYPEKCKQEAQ